jgi:competence protein ComEA
MRRGVVSFGATVRCTFDAELSQTRDDFPGRLESMPSLSLSRRTLLLAGGCTLLLVVAIAKLTAPSTSSSTSSTYTSGSGATTAAAYPSSPATTTVAELVVDVAGAVRRPGLYHLPQGSRIADAIVQAGGLTGGASAASVNLAAPLADGEQVLVPGKGVGGTAASTGSGAPSQTAPLDLNTATLEQLDALPGVGPVTAQKILDYRTQHGSFTSVDDLDAIPGIGPSRVANLQGLVIP